MRITLKKKSTFITTSEIARPEQLTRSLSIRDIELSHRLLVLQGKMTEAVSDLDMFVLDEMELKDVIRHMNRRLSSGFRLDFLSFWEEAVKDKPRGSRQNYMIALRRFEEYLGTDTLDISRVTSRLMRNYQLYLERKYGVGARAVTMYTAAVKHVYNLARLKYNDEEDGERIIKNPFDYYTPPKQRPSKHRDVNAGVIQTMIDTRAKLNGLERRAVDAFLLSFALMGMNAPDLLTCAPPRKDVIIYRRQKTRDRRSDNAEMHVLIDERIRPLYEQWEDKESGNFAFMYHRIHSNHRQFCGALSKGLAYYRRRQGIPDGELTFYSARHAWASLAYNEAGIDKHTINDCLCHVDEAMKVTDIYIHKDWSVLWNANARVLDLFNWDGLCADTQDSQTHR